MNNISVGQFFSRLLMLMVFLPLTVSAQQSFVTVDLGYVNHGGANDAAPHSMIVPRTTTLDFIRILDHREVLSDEGKPSETEYIYPHGLMRMKLTGIPSHIGQVSMALKYPESVQSETEVYLVNGDGFHQHSLVKAKGDKLYISLVDGGEGDLDQMKNGEIITSFAVAAPVKGGSYAKLDLADGHSLWSLLVAYGRPKL
jgi:hypothetical protein